jgi:hypothetical protein
MTVNSYSVNLDRDSRMRDVSSLVGDTDARNWAYIFAQRFMIWTDGGVLSRDGACDLMTTWFANAIEAGRDAVNRDSVNLDRDSE